MKGKRCTNEVLQNAMSFMYHNNFIIYKAVCQKSILHVPQNIQPMKSKRIIYAVANQKTRAKKSAKTGWC